MCEPIQELKGARAQHHRASKIAEIYKQQVDNLNDLYDKQDKMLGYLIWTLSLHFQEQLLWYNSFVCSSF